MREVITVGDPRLRERSRPVRAITPEIRELIEDMVETMHASDGIGLAAVQVAEMERIIVIELPEDEEIWGSGELYVVVNPEIVKESRDTETGIEGCLSIPGYVGEVERAVEVTIRGMDEHGKSFKLRPRGFLARVFQHEVDHLNGVLFIDRLVAPDRIWEVKPGTEEEAEVSAETSRETAKV
ncbi:MAG: peptide deformylase [Anaerolineae bacterium]